MSESYPAPSREERQKAERQRRKAEREEGPRRPASFGTLFEASMLDIREERLRLSFDNRARRHALARLERILSAFDSWEADHDGKAPTQESLAEAMGTDSRRLQEWLEPYPGLWKELTGG